MPSGVGDSPLVEHIAFGRHFCSRCEIHAKQPTSVEWPYNNRPRSHSAVVIFIRLRSFRRNFGRLVVGADLDERAAGARNGGGENFVAVDDGLDYGHATKIFQSKWRRQASAHQSLFEQLHVLADRDHGADDRRVMGGVSFSGTPATLPVAFSMGYPLFPSQSTRRRRAGPIRRSPNLARRLEIGRHASLAVGRAGRRPASLCRLKHTLGRLPRLESILHLLIRFQALTYLTDQSSWPCWLVAINWTSRRGPHGDSRPSTTEKLE